MDKDQEQNTKPAAEASKNSNVTTLAMSAVIAALVAFVVGYVIGNVTADDGNESAPIITSGTHEHADDGTTGTGDHSHSELYEVPVGTAAPEITMLMVTKDPQSGWNLMMQTENFTFSPENASGEHVEGEGHAHIYIDGKKITRLYSNNYYLGELSEGEHTIRVTLNTNDHKDYAVNGTVVEASTTITDTHHADDDSGGMMDGHSHGN